MKKNVFILMLIIVLVSCTTTTTPDKYLNRIVVAPDVYTKDTIALKKEVYAFYNLENKIYKKLPNQQRKILNLQIDTLIYGPDNKFVALVLIDSYNKIMAEMNGKYISYDGECVTGSKSDTLRMDNILVSKVSAYSSRSAAKRLLRNNYLRIMSTKKGIYNINDIRFWNTKVWNDSLVKKMKEFYIMQQDSTIETYP